MDIAAYFARIHYDGTAHPTADTLRRVHRAHMLSVPFENLDIGLQRPIVLDEELFFHKIVEQGRGGFCYELNGLFAALLRTLGYTVTLLSARVPGKGNKRLREFDHLMLRVDMPFSSNTWLADVGFGDAFTEPLRLMDGMEQYQDGVAYRASSDGDRWLLARRDHVDWNLLYDFSLGPHELSEFAEMCHYHQTSPDSGFTQRRICSRATPRGRITLADMRLIVTQGDSREERMLQSEEEYQAALWEHFGLVL